MAESFIKNFYGTTVTSQVGASALVADVQSTGNLQSPAYIVFAPRDATKREVWYADGTFTATRFVTSDISNRYLDGSAAGSGIVHDVGTEVWSVPVGQVIGDIWDAIDNLAADPHDLGGSAHGADTLANLNAKISDATLTDDHGELTGLADDDHTQYTKADGTRAFTGNQSMGSNKLTNVTDPTADQDAATKKYVDDEVAGSATQIATGTYEGNDAATPRTIALSFTPSSVRIRSQDRGNVFFLDADGSIAVGGGATDTFAETKVVAGGFAVDEGERISVTADSPNSSGQTYTYVAIG